MTDETNSDRKNKDTEDTGDEGMPSDFSNVSDDMTEETSEPPVDYNGMALSGILGEDVTVDARKDQPPETVQEEDYSDFLKDLGDFDSDDSSKPEADSPVSDTADTASGDDASEADGERDILEDILDEPEESVESYGGLELIVDEDDVAAVPVAEDGFSGTEMVIDEDDTSSGDGYASVLDELGGDTAPQQAEKSGEMGFLTLDEEDVSASEDGDELGIIDLDSDKPGDSAAKEVSASADEDTEKNSDFLEFDLGIDDKDTGADSSDEEQAVVIPSADEDGDDDFLGLSDDTGGGEEKSDDFGIDIGIFAEVLFEGIDMNFDEQALVVTRAELLLAQNKKDEALTLYRQLAEKGKTYWVAKRIKELS